MPWSKILIEKLDDIEASIKDGRVIKYADAVREALALALEADPKVYVMGQGVDDPDGMSGSSKDLHKQFGSDRVFDTPLSEGALMGIAAGSAIQGMRPIYMHNRPDFLLLALDQLVNHASKWRYMFGGQHTVPMVVWTAIGRGWGSGAQHSQALQAFFAHAPGLKVIMPSTPYDAKGLLLAAIKDENPVVVIEHRWVMRNSGVVPEGMYIVPIGKGVVRREGKDLTVVGASHVIVEANQAAEDLESEGIDAEVIDLRTIRPLDNEIILESVKKTGRLLVVDTGWKSYGVSAEIAAMVAEKGFDSLRAPIRRLAAPDCPTPSGYTLEAAFYISRDRIKNEIRSMIGQGDIK